MARKKMQHAVVHRHEVRGDRIILELALPSDDHDGAIHDKDGNPYNVAAFDDSLLDFASPSDPEADPTEDAATQHLTAVLERLKNDAEPDEVGVSQLPTVGRKLDL